MKTGREYLPPGGSYGPGKEKDIKNALDNILYNGACADAFQRAGLETPAGIYSKGLVIGPATLLLDPNSVSRIGITEAARSRDVGSVGSTQIQAITINDHPGYAPDTTDGRPRILLNASAFGGGALSLQGVLAHELVHAAGIIGKQPGFFGSLFGRHDLSYYKHYDSIMKACGR